jgi:hypothetical protein
MSWLLLVGFLLVLWAVLIENGSAVSVSAVVPWVMRSAQRLPRAAFDLCAEGGWLHGPSYSLGLRISRPPPLVGGPKVSARSP